MIRPILLCSALLAVLHAGAVVPDAHAQTSPSSAATPCPDPPGQAGTAGPGDASRMVHCEDVQVTATADVDRRSLAATKLDLTVRQTPQAITIVPREVLRDFALTSASDALATATTVRVERVETDRTYFSARGFDISNFQVDGLGLPFATGDQLGNIDMALYDRVEVLRGANGLTSFTGNPSATVNYVRKRPGAERTAMAGVTIGAWNTRRVDIDLGGALNPSKTVRARVAGAAQAGDSYLDRYSLSKYAFAGIVEADLTSRTRLALGHQRQQNEPRAPMWGALPLYFTDGSPTRYDTSTSTAADWSYWNTGDRTTFVEATHQSAPDWSVRGSVNHRTLDSDSELFYVYGTPDAATGLGLYSWPSKYFHTERQWIVDASASGRFTLGGRRHQVMFGVNWSESDNVLRSSDDDLNVALPALETWAQGAFPMPRPDFDQGITGQADFLDRRQSVFAAVRVDAADALKVIGGASVTSAESTGEQYGEPHAYTATRTSPYVGATYDIDERHSVYGNYTRIFNPQSKLDESSQVIAPVEGSNIEAGVKAEWIDGRVAGSASVFRIEQNNTAEYAGFANGRSFYRGVDATSTGFELEAAGFLVDGWQVSAGFARFSLTDDAGADVRTYVPRTMLQVSTRYRVPGLRGLSMGAAMNWQGDIHRVQGVDAAGSDIITRQPAFALVSVMARYEIARQWTASLNVNNLTNETYYGSLYWSQTYHGAPRHASLSVSYQF
jgi:outer membrane receptor for ferric coprogen and ferric-rhodotorulic acid